MYQRDLAQQDPEALRRQIDETRSSITEKLEALEEQVAGTVQNARESVEETIQTVQSSVRDTVESVQRTFDLKYQVEQHPWPMMGVSFLAGVAGAVLYDNLGGPGRTQGEFAGRPAEPRGEPAPQPGHPDWKDMFREEIDQAKGIAVGYVMALARDWAKLNFPDLAPQIDDFMRGATEKLGGSPIAHPVLHNAYEEASRAEEAKPFSRY